MSKTKKEKNVLTPGMPKGMPKSNIPTAAELENKLEMVKVGDVHPVSGAIYQAPRSLTSVFAPPTEAGPVKVTRLSLPPIVKPSEVGPGVTIMGTVLRVIPSPMKQYKSDLLVMQHPNGQFCWPLNAVTKRALSRYREKKDDTELTTQDVEGIKLIISGLGSTKTQDGLRTVKLFDIGVVE